MYLNLTCLIVNHLVFLFAGFASVARFDFSWGDAAYHQETLENLKIAIKSTKKLCAVSLHSEINDIFSTLGTLKVFYLL